ncbi:CheY-like chemotaxis protein/DNA-directed RNA polymerase specialized sigma24 family protein [Sagittula marina]|uniref:CheY-like chemotaxis protein/DNA-directed RNA polymerase specialized sigma24 family protein n=1 Tax=Sagittula marina TaxID=943940 RepID=A0A7W6DM03_9RHOB|nr:response regulator [Sagittula marina]MBB3983891.1 CheY-like chemotaxis protein/DNA-directed RNA polymerase specialized sigma24 family protein [Sagittula marina]
MSTSQSSDLTSVIGSNLPFLRRYARALTGSQEKGDNYAAATLEAILSDFDSFDRSIPAKVALFRVFQMIWNSTGGALADDAAGLAAKAQKHLGRLTRDTREALLLHTIEEMSFEEVGTVLDVSEDEARSLVDIAYVEMAKSINGKVMIIEDEAIIAMDLESIVGEMGHQVTGIAKTETEALALYEQQAPDLILSDIQLADLSSGVDAVNKILGDNSDIPVIFITAFPERLLTGESPEPAFLIAKPYTEEQVRSAVSQAMFFSSTETLQA